MNLWAFNQDSDHEVKPHNEKSSYSSDKINLPMGNQADIVTGSLRPRGLLAVIVIDSSWQLWAI